MMGMHGFPAPAMQGPPYAPMNTAPAGPPAYTGNGASGYGVPSFPGPPTLGGPSEWSGSAELGIQMERREYCLWPRSDVTESYDSVAYESPTPAEGSVRRGGSVVPAWDADATEVECQQGTETRYDAAIRRWSWGDITEQCGLTKPSRSPSG